MFKHIVNEGVESRTDKAIVITLLAQAIVSGCITAVTGTHIDDTVFILRHTTDHQIKATHLMPSDTMVVGFIHTASFRANIDNTIGVTIFFSVVIQDCRGLTTHIVRAHINPIEGIIGSTLCCWCLHSLKHVSGINQARLLVSAETAHKAFRIACLLAWDIVSTLVSDN